MRNISFLEVAFGVAPGEDRRDDPLALIRHSRREYKNKKEEEAKTKGA
jgi:hypothetical protein